MGQETTEIGTAQADVQTGRAKSDRLLGLQRVMDFASGFKYARQLQDE